MLRAAVAQRGDIPTVTTVVDETISMQIRFYVVLSLLFLLSTGGLVACGDNDGGLGEATSGSIDVSPSSVAFPLIEIGQTGEEVFRILNTSDTEDLRIISLDLATSGGGRINELSLEGVPPLPHSIQPRGDLLLTVKYSPTAGGTANRGEVRILSSDPTYTQDDPLRVPVNTLQNSPEIFVNPPQARFARIQPGQSDDQTVRITNIGSAPMRIFEAPDYTGGEDFRISTPSREYPLDLLPWDADAANVAPQEYYLDVTVDYSPLGAGNDTGQISVVTNDPRFDHPSQEDRGIYQVPVMADANAPCIEVDTRLRSFGQVPIGETKNDRVELRNCGTQTLEVNSVFFREASDVFRLDLGPWDNNGDEQIDNPVRISPGGQAAFTARFIPVEERTERATIVVASNDPVQPELELDLTARGAEGVCPTAVGLATVRGVGGQPRPSLTAVPLQSIILDASQSIDEDGEIASYTWAILERPPGTNVTLGPTQSDFGDNDQSRREFQVLTAGVYRVGLTVEDNSGFESCNQAEITVTAIPDQNIHIELTWTNPADPDETDDFGSDLDLQLTKMGPGRWFETPYSIYYLFPNRDQNSIWNPEDPSLDIDVRDGAGPENITMRNPQDCQWYAVGVHYYQQKFSTAYATVRIYINGSLRYERPFFPLENTQNFWDVARIHWNENTGDATIVEVDQLYPVEPSGQEPQVTQDMIDTGRCTSQGLY